MDVDYAILWVYIVQLQPNNLCKSTPSASQEWHKEFYLNARGEGFLVSFFQLVMGEGPSLTTVISPCLDDQPCEGVTFVQVEICIGIVQYGREAIASPPDSSCLIPSHVQMTNKELCIVSCVFTDISTTS